MTTRLFPVFMLLICLPLSAKSDELFNQNVIVNSPLLCVGPGCIDGETQINIRSGVKIKGTDTAILFEDTSSGTNNFPSNDWQLNANDYFAGGRDAFYLRNVTDGITPVGVSAGARSNALYINGNSRVGLGTSLAESDLHIVASAASTASLRLEELSGTPQAYELRSSSGLGFRVHDVTANTFPIYLRPGASSSSIDVQQNGDIGLGTNAPDGKLHTRGSGVQLAYFESSDGDAVQVRFRTDSQNRRFLAVNNANEVKSQIVFGDNQIQFLGETVAQEWLRISSAGIVSSGPTCNPNPCDATFDREQFTVPAIEDRAAYMWENMHLPAVGPTVPEAPFNVTEKMGGVIHELEIAHIYIEQLSAQNVEQQAQIEGLLARLSALEAQQGAN